MERVPSVLGKRRHSHALAPFFPIWKAFPACLERFILSKMKLTRESGDVFGRFMLIFERIPRGFDAQGAEYLVFYGVWIFKTSCFTVYSEGRNAPLSSGLAKSRWKSLPKVCQKSAKSVPKVCQKCLSVTPRHATRSRVPPRTPPHC